MCSRESRRSPKPSDGVRLLASLLGTGACCVLVRGARRPRSSRWCSGSHRTLRRSGPWFESRSGHWPCGCDGRTAVFGTVGRGSTPRRGAGDVAKPGPQEARWCSGCAWQPAKLQDQVRFLDELLEDEDDRRCSVARNEADDSFSRADEQAAPRLPLRDARAARGADRPRGQGTRREARPPRPLSLRQRATLPRVLPVDGPVSTARTDTTTFRE